MQFVNIQFVYFRIKYSPSVCLHPVCLHPVLNYFRSLSQYFTALRFNRTVNKLDLISNSYLQVTLKVLKQCWITEYARRTTALRTINHSNNVQAIAAHFRSDSLSTIAIARQYRRPILSIDSTQLLSSNRNANIRTARPSPGSGLSQRCRRWLVIRYNG